MFEEPGVRGNWSNWKKEEIKIIEKKKKYIDKFMTSQKRSIEKRDINESTRDSENQVNEAIGAIGKKLGNQGHRKEKEDY